MATSGSALSKAVNLQIADGLARGATGNSIAAALGIAPETVSRKKKALKGMIDALATHYFEQAAPITVDSTLKALKLANDILTDASKAPTSKPINPETGEPDESVQTRSEILYHHKDLLAVTDKKEARVLVSMGVSPSPATSVFINQLNIGGQQTILSPTITDLFAGVRCGDDDVIDVDCRDVLSNTPPEDGGGVSVASVPSDMVGLACEENEV